MANRTLNFHGVAFGEVPVQMNAHINGQLVFSGAVQPQSADHPDPLEPAMFANAGILFSVVDSPLFPTGSELTYPMTLSVATGECVFLTVVDSNYMPMGEDRVRFSGSISGTTLTVSAVTAGTISVGMDVILIGTTTSYGKIVSGSGTTWELNQSHTVPESSLGARKGIPGTPTDFSDCYPQGDARQNVQIDGIDQTPDRIGDEDGEWTWCINAGSTFECQLHVDAGSAP